MTELDSHHEMAFTLSSKVSEKKKKPLPSSLITYPTQIMMVGSITCLFVSWYKGGR